MSRSKSTLLAAAGLLIVTQVLHGATPSGLPEDEGGSVVGLVGGLALLVAAIVALVGLGGSRSWAVPLLGVTGAVVAAGFVLYHVVPVKSPLTNPYLGESGITAAAWAGLIACVAAGVWSAWLAFVAERQPS